MYMSQSTYDKLNDFLRECFQMNSFCDNVAYNMSALTMINTENLFHEKFAHAFPGFADQVSGLMVRMNAIPMRKQLSSNCDVYCDWRACFADLIKASEQYRQSIIEVIECADLNGDLEIKIFMEKFLLTFLEYLYQANVWYKKSEEYGCGTDFDQDFASFTFI